MNTRVIATLLVAATSIVITPTAALAGQTQWTNNPVPCSGSATQFLESTNPNVTLSFGQFDGGCTYGRVVAYVSLFGTNYTYSSGKQPMNGSLTVLSAPNVSGAYGNPNGMWADRWVGTTKRSTFVAP
jgi:hypothetical protein